jgi:plasmid replication initiation protein
MTRLTTRPAQPDQFDLFVPFISDLSLRDQRETMERPFFSLSKNRRLKPIEYVSPAGDIFVNVFPNPEFGMATIWDLDILIWAASVLNNMKRAGVNDLPRTLSFQPYDMLRTIGRDTGGREYKLLREALGRLQSTSIVTNIRAGKGKTQRQFSWIEAWSDYTDEDSKQSKGMTLTLSTWYAEGCIMDGGLLAIDPAYFSITGGRERWLYRVARKHAGGAGEDGFAIPLNTLFLKSGAEGTYRRFKFEMQALIKANNLPGYELSLEFGKGEPWLRMVRRETADSAGTAQHARPPARGEKHKKQFQPGDASSSIFKNRALSERTIEAVRRECPGWDIYGLQGEFDAWIADDPDRTPGDYQAAFRAFAKKHVDRSS